MLSFGSGKGKFIRFNAQDDLKGFPCVCPEAFSYSSPSRGERRVHLRVL